jgi:hypothetical protein
MDDRDIRTYLGQEAPQDDNKDLEPNMFSVMNDQTHWNDYYSYGNYECEYESIPS